MSRTRSLGERFWAKVDKSGPVPSHRPELGSCWVWTVSRDRHGYGRIRIAGQSKFAHRVSLTIAGQILNDDLVVDHLCRNASCVRTSHLEQVPQCENIRRGESPFAVLASVTSCPKGHAYDEANTYVRSNGTRECMACNSARGRARYAARRSAGVCTRGHVYAASTARMTKRGTLRCMTCLRETLALKEGARLHGQGR